MQEEKKPMRKEEYQAKYESYKHLKDNVKQDPHRLHYHLQPPMGWLNDPNGLCQIADTYHIYFQYTPFNPHGGTGMWGHMTTKDFCHYEEQEPSIYPDTAWDANGAYSGSAYEEEGTYYYFYTGNVKYEDKDYNYITEGREQNVILTTSTDGYHFTEKKLIMRNEDFPEDMSKHVRDPQVIKKKDTYFMLLGARDIQDTGCALLYESKDLYTWHYKLRFTTPEPFGYMWECPNLIDIEGHNFLLVCPQGILEENQAERNDHACGYFPLTYDFTGTYYHLQAYKELDNGFDFYAPQVFKDHKGRTILLGWMGKPTDKYHNKPTIQHNWQHALTLPRELYVTPQGTLAQRPLEELTRLRHNRYNREFTKEFQVPVPTCFDLNMQFDKVSDFTLTIRESAILSYHKGILRLSMDACGCGRGTKSILLSTVRNIRIMSDNSSLEIFINDGEETFTTRIYDSMHDLHCAFTGIEAKGTLELFEM